MTRHNPAEIKEALKAKGWTQEAAALQAGVTYEQVNRVLNGHRQSQRLLRQLKALPAFKKQKPVKATP